MKVSSTLYKMRVSFLLCEFELAPGTETVTSTANTPDAGILWAQSSSLEGDGIRGG